MKLEEQIGIRGLMTSAESFSIFMLYGLADKWNMTPAAVYKILNKTGILDDYIIGCYDVLHTQGKEYLVEDIAEYVKEKG